MPPTTIELTLKITKLESGEILIERPIPGLGRLFAKGKTFSEAFRNFAEAIDGKVEEHLLKVKKVICPECGAEVEVVPDDYGIATCEDCGKKWYVEE
jgi:predicted RNase H-like HicB family nuclease